MNSQGRKFVVIGAGPAGLTAAHQLAELGHAPTVLEKARIVGGLARTEDYKGYYFDMGGHRFYTKSALVTEFWEKVLGDDFLKRPRLSRIFYNGKFFDYPLKPLNALVGLGMLESTRIVASYARWKALPYRSVDTFEKWVTNRFGRRLFEVFFKSYTEKVWGISCQELRAEWAAQRIKDLSLGTALRSMFFKSKNEVRTLIDEFHYPRLGPGMLWNRVKDEIEERGGTVYTNSTVSAIERRGDRVECVHVESHDGSESMTIPGTDFISSMPVTELSIKLNPHLEPEIRSAAGRLHYRDFLPVCLVVNKRDVFPDNWIYVHDPAVQVARIQNYKNWSPDMVPNEDMSSLGLEYFCQAGDDLWNLPDSDLVELGKREIERIGLASAQSVEDGCVFRMAHAYPVYDAEYREFLDAIRDALGRFENLQTIGRNGLHRYNNQDHAMLTGMLAVENALDGCHHDLWRVNADEEYLEEVQSAKPESKSR